MTDKRKIIEMAEAKYVESLNRISVELQDIDYLTRLNAAKGESYQWLKTIEDPNVEDISCRAIRRLAATLESVFYSLGLDHNGNKIGPALDDYSEVSDKSRDDVSEQKLN